MKKRKPELKTSTMGNRWGVLLSSCWGIVIGKRILKGGVMDDYHVNIWGPKGGFHKGFRFNGEDIPYMIEALREVEKHFKEAH